MSRIRLTGVDDVNELQFSSGERQVSLMWPLHSPYFILGKVDFGSPADLLDLE